MSRIRYRVEIYLRSSPGWYLAGEYVAREDADRRADEIRTAGYDARVTEVVE